MKYLSNRQLKGFETYKYNSVDTCILSTYVMHPFWNWCVQFCPKWIAPNVLTFTGFLLTILNFFIFSWYDYDFFASAKTDTSEENVVPNWVWALASFNMFVAYTLDGIDGKQARRTGTSGPLGELFDHGLDSYTSVLIPIIIYSVYGRKVLSPLRVYFIVWLVFTNFYIPHWEKYNTGVMFLPWGYDFTMVSVVMVLLVTSIRGPSIWNFALPFNLEMGQALEIVLYTSSVITGYPIMLWNVYKSYQYKTGKMRTFIEALAPLVPYLLFFTFSTLWALRSPNNIIEHEPRIFYLLLGTIFSNISCRLIVSQMSNTNSERFNILLYPYIATIMVILTFHVRLHEELLLLYALTIILSAAHICYGIGVVNELCNHFNIKCFKITKEKS